MTRPTIYGDLVTTCVTVDREQLRRAKNSGINISDLLRDALREATHRKAELVKKRAIAKKFHGVPVAVVNHALHLVSVDDKRALALAGDFNKRYGTSLVPGDLLNLIPRY